jgi:DNA invertase Pin-like site-specific DNA recombinase
MIIFLEMARYCLHEQARSRKSHGGGELSRVNDQHDMNSKIVITLFSLFAELECDLISLRTKEAFAAKRTQGVLLGKPKGTIQKSQFDADLTRIKELLSLGLSVRKIAKLLGYSNHIALNTYINKRQLREHL